MDTPNSDQRETLFSELQELTDASSEMISVLKRSRYLEHADIPNIAITYSNKLIELQRQYEASGLSFYDGTLMTPIIDYLFGLVKNSLTVLNRLVPLIAAPKFDLLRPFKKSGAAEIEGILGEYRRLDDLVFAFTIEKEIGHAVSQDMSVKKKGDENPYAGFPNPLIGSYREELIALGLSPQLLGNLTPQSETIESDSEPAGPRMSLKNTFTSL